ncbi:MAG: alpha/beta hydrolase [Pirellulales bacterium]
MFRTLLSLSLALASASPAYTQQAANPPERPEPTFVDFTYARESVRQKFDLWQAKSEKPAPLVLLIHGGGWKNGDKSSYGADTIQPYLDAGVSVAALNYRFIDQAMQQKVQPPVMACLYDAARALQCIRSHARDWKIDPERIGATGSSAGACTSVWLALHDDLANSESNDPIARESTRLTCAAVQGAQTSLDPKELREWMPNAIYGGHAFGFAANGRSRAEEFDLLVANRGKVLRWIEEYSPIELASQDDPPIYLDYPNQKTPPVPGKEEPDPTHSAIYGIMLAERFRPMGVEVVVSYPGHQDKRYGSLSNFLIEKLSTK